MPKKIILSVVLATYNEAGFLPACLQSIKKLADEIIVVDGSSADNTRDLARQAGAKVFKVPNQAIFHINKQKAVDKAQGDWILQLDADERVSKDLAAEISRTIKLNPSPYAGYYLPRKNFFLTRFLTKGGQYPDYVIRLFKRHSGYFPCLSVHEQIVIKGGVGYLSNPLIHYADQSFQRYLVRFNRYTSLDAAKLFENKVKPGFWLGVNYCLFKPLAWFLSTYFRHKGFVDGLAGFIFSLMSSLRFPIIYFKFWELNHENRH